MVQNILLEKITMTSKNKTWPTALSGHTEHVPASLHLEIWKEKLNEPDDLPYSWKQV